MDKKKMIKVAGKIIIKHELKKKIREKVSDGLTSHTGSATAGFVAGAGAAQIATFTRKHFPRPNRRYQLKMSPIPPEVFLKKFFHGLQTEITTACVAIKIKIPSMKRRNLSK